MKGICLEGKTIGLRNSELLIIIPCYNESGNIEKTIKMIEEHTPEFDYVIINDCSTDHTLEICRYNNFNVIDLPINLELVVLSRLVINMQLKMAINMLFKWMEMVSIILNLSERCFQVLQEKNVNMVIGSRFIENQRFPILLRATDWNFIFEN